MRRALIVGISGQDGSYQTEYLLEQEYEVRGLLRRHSVPKHQESRIQHLGDRVHTHYGDVLDASSVDRVMREVMPDEIYSLAAQSHVRISFDVPQFTVQTNALGALNVLEVFRSVCPGSRFYQASSSEMFGNCIDPDGCQRETTAMQPTSPYGCAKLFAYNITRHYRKAHGLFTANGILFNHESPRRGSNFVTNKVCKTAVRIKLGLESNLVLGNLDSSRDWGHSSDYVRAMHFIVSHDEPDDFVVATGESHSIRELCDYVFSKLGMDYRDFVVQDKKYMRPEELEYLRGDASRAHSILGWEPTYTFETLLDEMIEHWLEVL